MTNLTYRLASLDDVPGMAAVRARDWGTEEYWRERIAGYLRGDTNPAKALAERHSIVCAQEARVVGLVAGHLTRRYGCDGELQWITVLPENRNLGIALRLLNLMAEWFESRKARTVCVDVDPGNSPARCLYRRTGAVDLSPHWMVWRDIRTATYVEQSI